MTSYHSTVFLSAFHEFIGSLKNDPTKKNQLEFYQKSLSMAEGLSPEYLKSSLEDTLKKKPSNPKLRPIYAKFQAVVSALEAYSGVIEVFVQAQPLPLSIIWGGLKILVQSASRFDKNFHKIQNEFEKLPDLIFSLSEWEDIHGTSVYAADPIRRIISRSYINLFEFWYSASKCLESPIASAIGGHRDLISITTDLEHNWNILNKVCSNIEAHLNKDMRRQIDEESALNAEMRQNIRSQFVKAAIESSAAEVERRAAEEERKVASEERLKAHRERLEQEKEREAQELHRANENKRFAELEVHKSISILRDSKTTLERDIASSANTSELNRIRDDKVAGTCVWIREHTAFQRWTSDKCHTPILWVNGKQGIGKSVLCASVIDYLREDPAMNGVAFQFITRQQYLTKLQLLGNIAAQLLGILIARGEYNVSSEIQHCLNNLNDEYQVRLFIRLAISMLPRTYILFDGLDEADYVDESHPETKQRAKNDLYIIFDMFLKEAQRTPERLRVWCSSQVTTRITKSHDKHQESNCQISLTPRDTAHDMYSFLMERIEAPKDMDELIPKALLAAAVSTEVEGSFLWVKLMLEGMNDPDSNLESFNDKIEFIEKSLPKSLENTYTMIIKRIQARADESNKTIPTWKIVLSLLTYCRRSMRLSEVAEAIAILRTPTGENIDQGELISPAKIMDSCMSLVRRTPTGSKPGDDFIRLTHSSVWVYLSDGAIDPRFGDVLVQRNIVGNCILRYLLQPRYACLLQREHDSFYTNSPKDPVTSHHLLSYAAKYWFHHCDIVDTDACNFPTSPQDYDELAQFNRQRVLDFLESSNFRTCIQVQSVFIVGNFIHRFDPLTGRDTSARRTLPRWILTEDPVLSRAYYTFESEWYHLLRFAPQSPFVGEIDRCFWASLGTSSFLAKHIGRYNSFALGAVNTPAGSTDTCRLQHLSPDGAEATMMWIRKTGNTNYLKLEQWSVSLMPARRRVLTMQFSSEEVDLDRYPLQSPASFDLFPLVPDLRCVTAPSAIQFSAQSELLRLGGGFFLAKPNEEKDEFTLRKLKGPIFDQAWESSCSRDDLIVLSRRRTPRQSNNVPKQLERRKRRSRVLTRAVGNMSIIESDNESESSDDSAATSESEHLPSDALLDLSTADESWTEGSTDSNEISSEDDNSIQSEASAEESDILSDISDKELEDDLSRDDVESDREADQSDSDDSHSVRSISEFLNYASSSEGSMNGYCSDRSTGTQHKYLEMVDVADETPGITIRPPSGDIICDICDKSQKYEWYHCIECSKGDFDVCRKCMNHGSWCFNVSHRLYRMIKRQPAGAVSRTNFGICQELVVCKGNVSDGFKPIFHLRKKYHNFLYESPPVIHDTKPLVVWPLTGSSVLFADIERKTFFEYKLKTPNLLKSYGICVSLSFSPCGSYLRVAAIDAEPVEKDLSRKSETLVPNASACFNLRVIVLRLHSTTPTRTPPKVASDVIINMGCCVKSLVSTFPFAFTWTSQFLFVTKSDIQLRLFRVELCGLLHENMFKAEHSSEQAKNQLQVSVPKQTIFLPRSSRDRSVQFFPGDSTNRSSMIIIGPRYGVSPDPTIGAELKESDLGGWIRLEETHGSYPGIRKAQEGLEGKFEEFDSDDDCDIIYLSKYL